MLVELEVVQVSMDPFMSSPVLVLRDPASDRRIVARLGQTEAVALLSVMEKISLDCPSAHDLALSLLEATGGRLQRVEIERRGETRTCATVVVADRDGRERRLSARV